MTYYREIWLIEGILLASLWIFDDYLASLITFIFVPIIFSVLVMSWIVEKISRSRIPDTYFHMMAGLTIIPVLFYIVFFIVHEGINWDYPE